MTPAEAAKLMVKFQLDVFECPEFTLRKSIHLRPPPPKRAARAPREPEVLDPAKEEQDNEPWMQIPEQAIESYAVNGRLVPPEETEQ
jgi:hypothetical protein